MANNGTGMAHQFISTITDMEQRDNRLPQLSSCAHTCGGTRIPMYTHINKERKQPLTASPSPTLSCQPKPSFSASSHSIHQMIFPSQTLIINQWYHCHLCHQIVYECHYGWHSARHYTNPHPEIAEILQRLRSQGDCLENYGHTHFYFSTPSALCWITPEWHF